MAKLEHCWDKRWPFEARKVYEIMANIKVRDVRSVYGTGEVETVGHHMEVRSFHVIAKTEAAARLAWWDRYKTDGENKIISCEAIASIDAEVSLETR